jgi:hypothetical protein
MWANVSRVAGNGSRVVVAGVYNLKALISEAEIKTAAPSK